MTTCGESCDTVSGWRRLAPLLRALALTWVVGSCAVSNDGLSGVVGADGTGGSPVQPTGGMPGTGGVVGAGGTGIGGALGTGGMSATGGAVGSGGSGTGGVVGTGGTGTGGVAGTGGMPATGGIMGTGGMPATGGATGTGGVPGTGGAVGTGGIGAGGIVGTGGAATGGAVGSGGTPGTGGTNPGGFAGTNGSTGGTGGASSSDPCQESRGEVVACFTFDGLVKDESKSQLDARPTSTPGFVDGVNGKALVTGPGRVVRVSSTAVLNLETFTIETNIRLDRLPSPGGRMGLVDSDLRYGLFVTAGGGLLCSGSGSIVVADGVVQAGKWHEVACARSKTATVLWVDGREVASQSSVSLPAQTPNKELVIGGNEPSGDELEGLIDTTRIWRTAQSFQR